MTVAPGSCLNCGEPLTGKFCSQCGQRDVPPYPTVHEAVNDAWHEFSGWDGRLATTLTLLLTGPGLLTLASLQGQRNRYIKPLRLYLAASVLYFFVRAVVPEPLGMIPPATVPGPNENVTVDLMRPGGVPDFTDEEREELRENLEKAPPILKPLLTEIMADPQGFQRRVVENMPRAFFVLVPAFAGVLALLFRRRRYMQHLFFALHLFTAAFLALTVGELSKYTGSLGVIVSVQLAAWLAIFAYALISLKRVYAERWLVTIAKAVGLGFLYMLIWMPVMVALLAWALLMK